MTQPRSLIPRKALFGNPERTEVRLSHDGARIAYLAPVDGVLNVWVAPVDAIEDARPVTRDTDRGIRMYGWTYNPGYLVYVQDRGGDEDWHVYAVDVETEETRDLTPYEGVHAYPQAMSDRFPGRGPHRDQSPESPDARRVPGQYPDGRVAAGGGERLRSCPYLIGQEPQPTVGPRDYAPRRRGHPRAVRVGRARDRDDHRP